MLWWLPGVPSVRWESCRHTTERSCLNKTELPSVNRYSDGAAIHGQWSDWKWFTSLALVTVICETLQALTVITFDGEAFHRYHTGSSRFVQQFGTMVWHRRDFHLTDGTRSHFTMYYCKCSRNLYRYVTMPTDVNHFQVRHWRWMHFPSIPSLEVVPLFWQFNSVVCTCRTLIYRWNTGATTQCITVSAAGTYTDT